MIQVQLIHRLNRLNRLYEQQAPDWETWWQPRPKAFDTVDQFFDTRYLQRSPMLWSLSFSTESDVVVTFTHNSFYKCCGEQLKVGRHLFASCVTLFHTVFSSMHIFLINLHLGVQRDIELIEQYL